MNVILRELEREDMRVVNRWRNDPTLIECLGANFRYIGSEVDDRWFEGYLANRDRAVRLAIIDGETRQLIGCVYLVDIHPVNRSAEFAIMIGEKDYWSRGYGEWATRAMLSHAFNDLNLHRVFLTVLAENVRAVRLYEKVGFRLEGTLRESVFKCGRYRDELQMAMLRSEYEFQ